jgi:predicted MPP superfamily phosphohydrolase
VTNSPKHPEPAEVAESGQRGAQAAGRSARPAPVDPRRSTTHGPFEEHPIPVVGLPPALEGLRILHLSDLHVRRRSFESARWKALISGLRAVRADLVAFTGDLMDAPGQEEAAAEAFWRLINALGPELASADTGSVALGVFGNHDTPALRRLLQDRLDGFAPPAPRVRWLENASTTAVVRIGTGRIARLRVLGLSYPEDPLRAALDAPADALPCDLTLMLAHYPSMLFPAADLGVPLVLAGHTHGGQIRVHRRLAPHTSCDLPPGLASGCLGLRGTTCCISRGMGEGFLEGFRINCPAQVPIYTLHPAPSTLSTWGSTPQVIVPW